MLMLPSGQVLFTAGSSQLYVFTPTGSPQGAWKPTVASVVPSGSNYTLTGSSLTTPSDTFTCTLATATFSCTKPAIAGVGGSPTRR